MESGDGVEMELSKGTPETSPEANGFSSQINKENEIVENGADAIHASSGSEETSKVEVPDFSKDNHEVSESARENNSSSNPIKKGGSDECSQFKKTKKNFRLLNCSVGELNEKRKALSQSSSFPSKGSLNTTTLTRQTRIASSKTNGHLTAKTTASSVQKTLTVNKGSGEVIISDKSARNGTSIEDGKSYDIKEKLSDSSLSTKNDEDAHSDASSTTPRAIKSTGCGFNFRLDERAEKRKEFFMKLEEKNHAKELEKTNLDAKSQENQEAEIRRLRKSLNFKATPMPSFYQEPSPPKVELKKIPPTRPRSPKLGRRKSSATTTDNPLEAVDSSENSTKSNDISATSKGNANAIMASKNPKPKTFTKLPSPKSTTADKHASNPKPMVEVHAITSSPDGGCIIRAIFLDRIKKAYDRNPELYNLLVDPEFAKEILDRQSAWRRVICLAINSGISTPGMSASLAYFDTYRRESVPANLVQAQRDYFGAHTYERTDIPGAFHTEWFKIAKQSKI